MFQVRSNYGVNPRTIGGLMEEIFHNGFGRMINEDAPNHMNVPVNIKEDEKNYEVHLVAPGLKKEDFKLGVEKNVLSISFDHKEEATEETGKWLRKEYSQRSFKRSFKLNEKINAEGISAKYNDGILVISLPKNEVAEPKKHEITVG
jgi:Molecular chaperone (small heat shock protein)